MHEGLRGVKFLSLNYLFQSLHALDMLLNSLSARQQVLAAFPADVLEQFKPVVDILAALQQWHLRFVFAPLLASSIERVKTFFELLRRKVYISGEQHTKEYVLAD